MIPPLATARLALRPFEIGDVVPLYELWIREAVRRYLWDGKIISVDQARSVVLEAIADAARSSIGMWTLWVRGDPHLAGHCGFRWIGVARPATTCSPESTPGHGTDVASEPELLYALRPDLWGQGLATEAARKCIEWLFQTRPASRILAGADAANETSQRVLERLGFVPFDGRVPGPAGIRYFALARPGSPSKAR